MSGDLCPCGHPWHHHEFVQGFTFGHGITMSDSEGREFDHMPDKWVCTGEENQEPLRPGESPWDRVCGCVLFNRPPLRAVKGESDA